MSDKEQIVYEIVTFLRTVERFNPQDLANTYQYLHPATLGECLTAAYDIVRIEDGIEFRPGLYGSRQRATCEETVSRAMSQRRAGLRKLKRSVDRLSAAERMSADDKERERIQRARDHQKFQLVNAQTRERKLPEP
jgi:hypothetical protein